MQSLPYPLSSHAGAQKTHLFLLIINPQRQDRSHKQMKIHLSSSEEPMTHFWGGRVEAAAYASNSIHFILVYAADIYLERTLVSSQLSPCILPKGRRGNQNLKN